MLAGICAVKCRLSAMPPATREVVSWGTFFSERGKVCYHVTGFLEVKAIGSALQIPPESW